MSCATIQQIVVIACALAATAGVQAQDAALPVPAARLATALPVTAGAGATRQKPVLEDMTSPFRLSSAKVTFQGPRGSTEPFVAVYAINDDGAANAKMYGYGAKYLKEDVKSSSEHSLKLPGGRRALVTEFTARSMQVETFVADRFVARVSCMQASEDECIAASNKFDFKAIEALKP